MAVPYRLIIRYRVVFSPIVGREADGAHVYPYAAQLQVNDRVHIGYGDTDQEAEQQLRQKLMSDPRGQILCDLISPT